MKETRYVTRRGSGDRVRWYWQRKGFRLTRLPDVFVDRMAMVEQLNANADLLNTLRAEPLRGSVGWVIARYKTGDGGQKGKAKSWADLAARSRGYYTRFLADIDRLSAHLPFGEAWTRRAVIDFIEKYPATGARRQARTVLQNLFAVARYYGLVKEDHTSELRLKTVKPRDRVWADDELERWVAVADQMDPELVTPFMLLQYSAQRPGDVLAMSWADYRGGHIRVRQEKTKRLLDVPVHPDLAAHLEILPRRAVRIVTSRGRPVAYHRFNQRFRAVCQAAGIDAQARDLRRTAMLNMAIAGAEIPDIASVSGHSIDATTRILETYLPRNTRLAERAISALVEFKRRSK